MDFRYPTQDGGQTRVNMPDEYHGPGGLVGSTVHSQLRNPVPASIGTDSRYSSGSLPTEAEGSQSAGGPTMMRPSQTSSPDRGSTQYQHNTPTEAYGHAYYPNIPTGWFPPYVPALGVPMGIDHGTRFWPSNGGPSNFNVAAGPSQQHNIPNVSPVPNFAYTPHPPHSITGHSGYVVINPNDGQARNLSVEPYEPNPRTGSRYSAPNDFNERHRNCFPVHPRTSLNIGSPLDDSGELIAPSPGSPSGASTYSTASLGDGSTSEDSPLSSGVRLSGSGLPTQPIRPQESARAPLGGRSRGPPPEVGRPARSRPSIYTVPEAENRRPETRRGMNGPGIPVTININIECKLTASSVEVGNVRVEVRRPANYQTAGRRNEQAEQPRGARAGSDEEAKVKEENGEKRED
ncbi:hypothetical protein GGS26DRAFT_591710 [Hypomontagnella submonticulosa]|nr:hypothetical protein GGS26DRAFT_591710 [Hypomontagnella submonticulosa]